MNLKRKSLSGLWSKAMGKGSAPRPFSVANEEYASRWDAIFGKDKNKEQKKQEAEEMLNMPHDQMVKMAYGITDKKEEKK
jgi:hypothetical protein